MNSDIASIAERVTLVALLISNPSTCFHWLVEALPTIRNRVKGRQTIDETAINAIGDRVEISAWTRPNSNFSYEDFVDVGWKQYEIYEGRHIAGRSRSSLRVL